MRFPGLTGFAVYLAIFMSAPAVQAQTAADARKFLTSKDYRLHNNTAITYDDILVKKARTLIEQGQYKAALKVLDELDTLDGFDTARINYVPDMAIVALAADNVPQYDYFRVLALDAVKISSSKSVCRQDPYYHLQSDEEVSLERREDITIRVCSSSLTVNKPVSLNSDFEAKMAFLDATPTGPRSYVAEAPAAPVQPSSQTPVEPRIMVMSARLDSVPVAAQAGAEPAASVGTDTAVAMPGAPLPYAILYAPEEEAVTPPAPKRKTEWVIPGRNGEAEKPYRPRRKR